VDRDSDRQADRVGWTYSRTGKDKEDTDSWENQDSIMSCSDSGSEDLPVGAQGDLASRTLVLESKRFYLDVKENQRGRFIKIAEISADGRKNQILMTFSTAALFSQNLIQFIDFYRDLDKLDPDNLRQGELKSEVMYKDDKKYHMDLKENARGRFLKVSETFTRGYSRFQVFIPADGMGEFQHNLGELIDEYDNGEEGIMTKHIKFIMIQVMLRRLYPLLKISISELKTRISILTSRGISRGATCPSRR